MTPKKRWRANTLASEERWCSMADGEGLFVSWLIETGEAVEAELLDIDLRNGICQIQCQFSFVDWTNLVLNSRLGLTETEVDRLPMLPAPGAPVQASIETKGRIQIDVGSLDELTDYLAPSIGSGDFQFFTESNWKVTRYRQLAIHESEEEWLASGFIVNDSGE